MPLDSSPPQRIALIVDDEIDILTSLKRFLERKIPGLKVVEATSGQQALELLRKSRVDVVVTDFKMPQMNGLDFLVEAKKVVPKVPCILMTAFPDIQLAVRAINETRIEGFVTKPIEPSNMVEVVQTVLAESRQDADRDQAFAHSLDALRRHKGNRPDRGPPT